jgi:cytochrome c oxidase subunit II
MTRMNVVASAPDALAGTAPLNFFLHAAGPAAAPTLQLDWIFMAICVAVCVIVGALLIGAIFRRRPAATHHTLMQGGNGLRWITTGVGISTVVLVGMLVYALLTLQRVATPGKTPGLTITVTAYDWWWKVTYDDAADPSQHFTTANEIHIPAGVPVRVRLKSADVIHTFWVPKLAGKTQAIPGQTNEQWIQADAPGVYRGQCSQFCGAQHAHMAFEVVAENSADFAAWAAQQARETPMPTEATAKAGQAIFLDRCAGCHAIRGSDANGALAPDLTHLDSRRLIAAATLSNSANNQLAWITEAQRIKPDSLMPSIALTRDDAASLCAYLATLK